MKKIKKSNLSTGSTLYFALVILSIASIIVFSISTILTIQIKTIKSLGDSILAFCAADTGIERTFYMAYQQENINIGDSFSEDLNPDLRYDVNIQSPSECGAGAQYFCIKSIGTFLPSSTKRGIQASI